MMIRKVHCLLLASLTALMLSACGGGGREQTPVENPAVPASAGASSQGFLAYIASLANYMWDTAEPRDTSGFAPPGDNADTQEPIRTSNDV